MKELQVLDGARKNIVRALTNLKDVAVTSDSERAIADIAVRDAKKIIADVGRMRLGFTRVFDNWKQKFMDKEKELTAELITELKITTAKIDNFNNGLLENIRRDTMRINNKYDPKINAADSIEESLELEVDKQSELLVLPTVEGARVVRKWGVEDIMKVPQEYFTLDKAKIDQEVKDGGEIEGIKIYHVTVRTGRG